MDKVDILVGGEKCTSLLDEADNEHLVLFWLKNARLSLEGGHEAGKPSSRHKPKSSDFLLCFDHFPVILRWNRYRNDSPNQVRVSL